MRRYPAINRVHVHGVGIGVLLAICALAIFLPAGRAGLTSADAEEPYLHPDVLPESRKSPVHLYFADREFAYLMSEQRVPLHSDDPVRSADAIMRALIKGPQKGLIRTIPPETELRAIYLTSERVCYIDLSEAVRKNHPGGCHSELLSIYSMVNSLILNIPEIVAVKILINGNEATTLAGHIDIEDPLHADMLLIR
jgi:spore germination protein GerM